jgi:hypothetical protein
MKWERQHLSRRSSESHGTTRHKPSPAHGCTRRLRVCAACVRGTSAMALLLCCACADKLVAELVGIVLEDDDLVQWVRARPCVWRAAVVRGLPLCFPMSLALFVSLANAPWCRATVCCRPQLWNLLAESPPVPGAGGAESTQRYLVWALAAARVILSLRQSDFPAVTLRDEMTQRILKWTRMEKLPYRSFGTGLMLCTSAVPRANERIVSRGCCGSVARLRGSARTHTHTHTHTHTTDAHTRVHTCTHACTHACALNFIPRARRCCRRPNDSVACDSLTHAVVSPRLCGAPSADRRPCSACPAQVCWLVVASLTRSSTVTCRAASSTACDVARSTSCRSPTSTTCAPSRSWRRYPYP